MTDRLLSVIHWLKKCLSEKTEKDICRFWTSAYKDIIDWLQELDQYRKLGTPSELAALVKARDEGRLVELPVPLHTKCFAVVAKCDMCIETGQDTCLNQDEQICIYENKYDVIETVFMYGMIDMWGKTVFATKAEAEEVKGDEKG